MSGAVDEKPTWQIVMRVLIAETCAVAFILGAVDGLFYIRNDRMAPQGD